MDIMVTNRFCIFEHFMAFKVKYIFSLSGVRHNGRCGHFRRERQILLAFYRMDFNFLVRRYKQIAATRLAIAGLNVAYGIKVSISCQYTYLSVCLSVCLRVCLHLCQTNKVCMSYFLLQYNLQFCLLACQFVNFFYMSVSVCLSVFYVCHLKL